MAALTVSDAERKVVAEFVHLNEKSKQLFNGLRDLPLYGNKQWEQHFGRTFDVYNRLWKFQQQHRQVLDTHYGLKRWQVGEVASKIGQLYYHYYLRTSETAYLLESFSFYSAIRSRQYYSKASKEDKPDLMVKKLRYYARFIVVCLLLKKLKLVRDLIRELSHQIEDYVTIYYPEDHLEWSLVLTEAKSFVEADSIVNVVDVDSATVILSHRLTPYNTPPLEKGTLVSLSLQEVLIVGNTCDQVKFSELTLDMFWMVQALEREPQEVQHLVNNSADASPAPGRNPYDDSGRTKENPHKYLMYKPTFSCFMMYMTIAMKELAANAVILLYISADGVFEAPKRSNPHQRVISNSVWRNTFSYLDGIQRKTIQLLFLTEAYEIGGVLTNRRECLFGGDDGTLQRRVSHVKDCHCIHPGDLYPFLRKPMFIIVDSDNSNVFLEMPNLFGQPLVVLTSPIDVPVFLREQPQRGSLFTLFLHSPLTAFCYVCNIHTIPLALWDKCQAHIDKFMCEAGRLLVRSPSIDRSYKDFYGDDFLRLLMLRYIFCQYTLSLHRSFKNSPGFHPHCHPPLPDGEILRHPTLIRFIIELARVMDVLSAFREADETVC